MIELQLYFGGFPRGEPGFLGEVPVSELITGDALASAIGLTAGTTINSNEPWLHLVDPVDGKTKYIAKKHYRHSVTWNQLHELGAVFGSKTLVINGRTYMTRLLKGANSNPSMAGATQSFDHPHTHGSEWNRLMYHISGKPYSNTGNTLASEGITEGDWASYSEVDLDIRVGSISGKVTLCQDTVTSNPVNRLYRGYWGVSGAGSGPAKNVSAAYGWRPCLELMG